MVATHPETLEEMNDVMTSIGHRWEAKAPQYYTPPAQQPGPNKSDDSDSSLSEPIYSQIEAKRHHQVLNRHTPLEGYHQRPG